LREADAEKEARAAAAKSVAKPEKAAPKK